MKCPSLLPTLLIGAALATGCGDKSPKSTVATPAEAQRYQHTTMLEGTVSTGRMSIKTGKIDVIDKNSKHITQTTVENGHFRVEIPAYTTLPVLLNFSSDSYADKLLTVVIDPNVTRYYIDPSTTAIAKVAKSMGGYTRANLVRAAEETTHAPDANKTTAGWRGDPTTQYGGWH